MTEYLIANGHAVNDVFKYPLRQLVLFHNLAVNRKRKESLELMVMMRNVQHAEHKEFRKTIKTMETNNK